MITIREDDMHILVVVCLLLSCIFCLVIKTLFADSMCLIISSHLCQTILSTPKEESKTCYNMERFHISLFYFPVFL